MAGPWEDYAPSQAPAAAPQGPWADYAPAPAPQPVYKGSFLPISRDAQGNVSFDASAGVLGMVTEAAKSLYSAATLPGDVYAGKVEPTSPEAVRRAFDLATVATPINPAVRAGDRAIPGLANNLRREPVKPPTADELYKVGGEGFDRVRDMGVDYSADAVARLAQSAGRGLENQGFIPKVAPDTHAILAELAAPPAGGVAPISGLEAARRSFGHIAGDFTNPREQAAAKVAQNAIDGFIRNADPSTVVAGDAAAAGRALTEARANWAAGARSDQINGIERAAELRAAGAGSGQNLDNTLRQRLASLLLDPKKAAGFNEAERGAMEGFVRGEGGRDYLRSLGNALGGGGGIGTSISAIEVGS